MSGAWAGSDSVYNHEKKTYLPPTYPQTERNIPCKAIFKNPIYCTKKEGLGKNSYRKSPTSSIRILLCFISSKDITNLISLLI